MSLQVWLPLNGNLENFGLRGNVSFAAVGATIASAGKIGSCYQFNGSNNYLSASYNFYNTNYSVAAWIYSTSSSTTQTIVCDRTAIGSGFSIFLIGGKIRIDCGGNNLQWIVNYTYPINTWFHLVVTYDGTNVSYYINGIFKEKKAQAISSSYWGNITSIGASQASGSGYGNFLNGKLNDIRIYDHTLSAKEVEELARGLVLHYKLDNNGMGGENLALHTHDLNVGSSKNNLNMYVRGASTRQLRSDGFYESKGTASWQGLSFWANQLNLTPGTKITYSFYIYGNGSSRAFSFYPMMYNSANTRDTSTGLPISVDGGPYTTSNSKPFTATTATSPEYHYVTFEWNQAVADIISNGGSIELSIQVHGTWNSGDWACIFAPKVEIGDKPTPWSPAQSEIGVEGTIYDSSGYGHHGVPVGTITATNPSPRYNAATQFPASGTNYIRIGTQLYNVKDEMTISLWAKANDWTSTSKGVPFSSVEGGGFGWQASNANYVFYCGTGASSNNYASSTVVVSDLSAGWHMLSATYDGLALRTYIDGELKNTVSKYSTKTPIYYNNNSGMFISGESAGNITSPNGSIFRGSISDVRIYVTALTSAAIQELYHTSATIDKSGNVYAREVVEA